MAASPRKKVVLADIRLTPAFSRVVTDEITRKLLYHLQVVGEASTYQLAKQVFPEALKEKYDTVRRRLLELEKWGLIDSKRAEGKEESGLPRRIYFRTYFEFFDIFWAEMEFITGREGVPKKSERQNEEKLSQIMRTLFSSPKWPEAFAVMREEYGLTGDRYPSLPYLMSEELPLIDPFDFSNFLSMLEEAARRKFAGVDSEIRTLLERFLITWGRGEYSLNDFVEFKPYLPKRVKEYGIAEGVVLPAASPSVSRLLTSPLDFAILMYLHEGRHDLQELEKEFDLTPERAEAYCEERREAGLLEREVIMMEGGHEKKIYRFPEPQRLLLDNDLWREVEHSHYDKKIQRAIHDSLGNLIDKLTLLWLNDLKEVRRKRKITGPIPESFLRDLVYTNIANFYEHVNETDLFKQAKKLGIPVVPIYEEEERHK